MKRIKFYMSLLFFFLGSQLAGQVLSSPDLDFYVEGSLFSSELQIKPFLFKTNQFGENLDFGGGGELLGSFVYKKKWTGQVGLAYSWFSFRLYKTFDFVISNPSGAAAFTNTYSFSINDQFVNHQLDFELSIDQANCFADFNRTRPDIKDGDSFGIRRSNFNVLKTLGIPIKLGRILMLGKFKWYLNVNMVPVIIISKKVDLGDRKRVELGLTSIGHPECFDANGNRIERFSSSAKLTQKNWNIINNRIDLISELGFLHQTKSSQYKIGVFYGESLTPFTKVENKKHTVQTAGIKIAYARSGKKKAKSN